MKGHLERRLGATCVLVACAAPATVMAAQPAPPAAAESVVLEEVVVTAQHVEENLQKSAISAIVATGDTLIDRGINDNAGLAKLVPGISIVPNNAYTNYNIRGITSGGVNALSDTAIAVNYNQVSLATPSSASGLYYDLERVELVNGPQGTLYGRNATAGAINVVARRPTLGEFNGTVGADFGNFSALNVRGAFNIPLTDTIAMRIAGQTVEHSGYYSDGGSDQNDKAVRISFLAVPNDNLSFYLTADYARTNSHGLGTTLQQACGADFCYIADEWTGLGDLMEYLPQPRPASYNDSYFWGITGNVEWTTGHGTLTVIPAYRRHSAHTIANNASFGSLKGFDEPYQQSLEVRFQSPQDRRLKYQVGFYALSLDVKGVGGSETAAARSWSANYYTSKTESYAPFAQLTFGITDTFRVVAGARYTTDKKETDSLRYTLRNVGGSTVPVPDAPPPTGPDVIQNLQLLESHTWKKTTYKAGLEWDVTDSTFAYFDVRSGFKAGGFFFAPPGNNTYDPENLTAYSFGIKNRFFNNRLQANLEAFLYDYEDQQLSVNLLLNQQQVVTTQNVGNSKIKGVELSLDFLATASTRIGADVRYATGDYDSLVYVQSTPKATSGVASTSRCTVTPLGAQYLWDCSGLGFINLPKWAYNLDVTQSFGLPGGGELSATANYRYTGARDTSLLFTNGSRADANKFMDASIQYRPASGNWDVTAFYNDLIRSRSITRAQAGGANGSIVYFSTSGRPKTYGLRMNYRF
jgi:iron complex outermembrane receptor protein